MSTQPANDKPPAPAPQPSTGSGMTMGLIIGAIVLIAILIAVGVYMVKRRSGGANVPSGAPTATNGYGVMNQGSNAVPRTTMNMNAGRTTV